MRVDLKCPVCRARLQETDTCRRCDAGLVRLQFVAALAYVLRRRATEAFRKGLFAASSMYASRAQGMHYTQEGRHLALLASWAMRHGKEVQDQLL